MKRSVFLLAALVLLYLVPALILEGAYGESYALFSGSGYWSPDGQGGWIEVGNATEPEPEVRSKLIPLPLLYLPLVLPAAVLALFLFTPLSKLLRDDPDSSGEDGDLA
ncbi:MAG: hypothetical protein ACE5FH_09985 [Candidatus Zixiibacteriota bacterium]